MAELPKPIYSATFEDKYRCTTSSESRCVRHTGHEGDHLWEKRTGSVLERVADGLAAAALAKVKGPLFIRMGEAARAQLDEEFKQAKFPTAEHFLFGCYISVVPGDPNRVDVVPDCGCGGGCAEHLAGLRGRLSAEEFEQGYAWTASMHPCAATAEFSRRDRVQSKRREWHDSVAKAIADVDAQLSGPAVYVPADALAAAIADTLARPLYVEGVPAEELRARAEAERAAARAQYTAEPVTTAERDGILAMMRSPLERK